MHTIRAYAYRQHRIRYQPDTGAAGLTGNHIRNFSKSAVLPVLASSDNEPCNIGQGIHA
jgi:hypothetical protein